MEEMYMEDLPLEHRTREQSNQESETWGRMSMALDGRQELVIAVVGHQMTASRHSEEARQCQCWKGPESVRKKCGRDLQSACPAHQRCGEKGLRRNQKPSSKIT